MDASGRNLGSGRHFGKRLWPGISVKQKPRRLHARAFNPVISAADMDRYAALLTALVKLSLIGSIVSVATFWA